MTPTSANDARRTILDDELEQLRELPYSHWRALVGSSKTKTLVGTDGQTYRVVVMPAWHAPRSSDVQVRITVRRTGWIASARLDGSFVATAAASDTRSQDTADLS